MTIDRRFRFSAAPLPLMTGTLGAFIRHPRADSSKRMLFDIGIAGPIAGFVVAVPALSSALHVPRRAIADRL